MRPFTCLTVLVLLAPATAAQEIQPLVRVQARAIAVEGTGKASAGGSDPFVPGQTLTRYLYAGSLAAGQSPCILGAADATSSKTVDSLRREYAHVWRVTTTAVKYESGTEIVDLDWARYGPDAGSAPVISARQRLTLTEGQRYLIDLLHASPDTQCQVATVTVEIEAGVRESPGLADTLLQYDLWLIRRDAGGGPSTTYHVITTGMQGREVPFTFAPLRMAVPKLVADQFDFDVITRVSGRIRGRLREDGRIALEMYTNRTDDVARRGVSPPERSAPDGEGRKRLDVAPGEAIELQVPARTGVWTGAGTPAAEEAAKGRVGGGGSGMRAAPGSQPRPPEPVAITDGRLVVNYPGFIEVKPVSVIVQVKRQ